MLRYFVLATAIVVGAGVLIAGWVNRDMIRIKLASVYASAPPKPEPAVGIGTGSNAGLRGDAPWALSALPECLTQKSESTGPLTYVLAHLPSGAVAIEPPANLHVRDCGIELDRDAIYVRRGSDRFRIPPPVRFYRFPGGFALLRERTGSGSELRVYEPSEGSIQHE